MKDNEWMHSLGLTYLSWMLQYRVIRTEYWSSDFFWKPTNHLECELNRNRRSKEWNKKSNALQFGWLAFDNVRNADNRVTHWFLPWFNLLGETSAMNRLKCVHFEHQTELRIMFQPLFRTENEIHSIECVIFNSNRDERFSFKIQHTQKFVTHRNEALVSS